VVVPVFNGMPYLQAAYDSIAQQTYPNIEIVLVDGGSSDASLDWLARLDDPRASVHYLPKGTPAATTWTRACELATGEFIKLLCQDDLIYPDAVSHQVADLQRSPDAVLAAAQRDIITSSGKTLYRRRGCTGVSSGEMSGDAALRVAFTRAQNIFGEPLAVLFRREALMEHLPWVDTYPFMLDLDMYARAARGRRIVIRKESIGAFRVSSSSWSTRMVTSQKQQFARWQHDLANAMPEVITPMDRTKGRVGLAAQTTLRRFAYRWLSLRRDLA